MPLMYIDMFIVAFAQTQSDGTVGQKHFRDTWGHAGKGGKCTYGRT